MSDLRWIDGLMGVGIRQGKRLFALFRIVICFYAIPRPSSGISDLFFLFFFLATNNYPPNKT